MSLRHLFSCERPQKKLAAESVNVESDRQRALQEWNFAAEIFGRILIPRSGSVQTGTVAAAWRSKFVSFAVTIDRRTIPVQQTVKLMNPVPEHSATDQEMVVEGAGAAQ